MKSQLIGRILGVTVAAVSAFGATSASAQTSTPTRVDLDSDLLNTFNDEFVQDERAFLDNADQFQVDLNDLVYTGFGENNALEIFFINEGAGFRNALSLSVDGSNISNTVFSDISSSDSIISERNGALDLGQGVSFLPTDLQPVAEIGDSIEFFLNANGREDYVYSTTESRNLDGLQHVVGFREGDFLILGFEDLFGELKASGIDAATGLNNEGSDRDFNDVVIAVRGLSVRNQDVPEPGLMLGMAGVVAGMLKLRRKQEQ